MTQKSILWINFFVMIKLCFFFFKGNFKVTLLYLFNVFILFKTVLYLKFNFKLKIDPKMPIFKNLEEI